MAERWIFWGVWPSLVVAELGVGECVSFMVPVSGPGGSGGDVCGSFMVWVGEVCCRVSSEGNGTSYEAHQGLVS